MSQETAGDVEGLCATEHKSESWDLINRLPCKIFTLTKNTEQRLNEHKWSRQLSISFSHFKKGIFSPSIDVVCNPETECKTQEKEGVTQPAAGMFSVRSGSKPPITRKWLMPITVSPPPSTTSSETVWENSPVITKATYTSLSPQPAPGPSSPAPPFRCCPKQKSVSSAGDFWAGGKWYKLACLTQLIQTFGALCQDYSWGSPDALPFTASSDSS